jgi:hypothetical protein
MAWSAPEHDFGAAISAYQVDCAQVNARQQRAQLAWHRAYCGAATTCEARALPSPGRNVKPPMPKSRHH